MVNIPEILYSDTQVSLDYSSSLYIPSTHKIKIRFSGPSRIPELTATANGDAYSIIINVLPVYSAGRYSFQVFAQDNSGINTIIETGWFQIYKLGDKSHAEKVLDAIEAVIEGVATREQADISIAGKQIRYKTFDELIKLKSYYEFQIKIENNKHKTAQSKTVGSNILIRFGDV